MKIQAARPDPDMLVIGIVLVPIIAYTGARPHVDSRKTEKNATVLFFNLPQVLPRSSLTPIPLEVDSFVRIDFAQGAGTVNP